MTTGSNMLDKHEANMTILHAICFLVQQKMKDTNCDEEKAFDMVIEELKKQHDKGENDNVQKNI